MEYTVTVRRLVRLPALIVAALVMPTGAAAEDVLFEEGLAAWEAGEYAIAYDKLIEYRNGPYDRRPEVDYILGTSGCRMPERHAWGHDVLDWMLYAYPLTEDSRATIADERDRCKDEVMAGRTLRGIDKIVEERAATMTGFSDQFAWATEESDPITAYPLRRTRSISEEKLAARLIPLTDLAGAEALAASLRPSARVLIHEHFLLIGDDGHSEEDLVSIGQTLEAFLRFLLGNYDIQPPAWFITVHLLPSPNDVRKLALKIHGLDASRRTVSYAFLEDASVAGAAQGDAAGVIMHELFHLLVRARFGDIPQWLDEGIGALYEAPGRRADDYFGLPNWRGRVLEELWSERPTINELIRSEWFLLDDPTAVPSTKEVRTGGRPESDNERRQAAMMAMARYFALYLDQRGELDKVFKGLRDRGFGELNGSARAHAVAIVESTLGRTVADIDQDFTLWFRSGGPALSREARQPLASVDADHGDGKAYVTRASVNVRAGPSTNHDIVSTLEKGTRVVVFGEREEWFEVRLPDDTQAYIHGDYLEPVAAP